MSSFYTAHLRQSSLIEDIYAQHIRRVSSVVNTLEAAVLICLLEQDDPQSAKQLARAVSRAQTSFTPVLDRLQERQLLERAPHQTDRRSLSISLTDHGHDVAQRLKLAFAAAELEVLDILKDHPDRFVAGFFNVTPVIKSDDKRIMYVDSAGNRVTV